PVPTVHLTLAGRKRAYPVRDHWLVEPDGVLQFHLALAHAAAVNFTLQLADGRAGAWVGMWNELAGGVKGPGVQGGKHRVRAVAGEKLAELRDQVERAWKESAPQAGALEEDLRTLKAYLRLHERQLEEAFDGPPDQTLAEVITRTGDPEALVRDLLRAP